MPIKNNVISVIVISYNSEKTIKRTIDSIIKQKGEFELEIIVVDDGSDDKAVDIIKNLAMTINVDIKIIINSRSDGVNNVFCRINNSMHKAVMAATGQYIRFISADDYFFEDTAFEKQLFILKNHQEYIACAGKFYWGFYGDRLIYRKSYDMNRKVIDKDIFLKNNCYIHLSALLIRNIFSDYRDEWRKLSFDDIGMMLLLLKIGKIAILDEFICVYSQRFVSVCNGFGSEKEFNNYVATITWLSALQEFYGKEYIKIIAFYLPVLRTIYHNRKKFLEVVNKEWKEVFNEKNCIFLMKYSGNFWEYIQAKLIYAKLCFLGKAYRCFVWKIK